MNKVTVSAPGKLMLLGEHAVVYGHPCIVTAVDQRLHLTAAITGKGILKVDAPDVRITKYEKAFSDLGKGEIMKGVKFVEFAVKNFLGRQADLLKGKGVKITTKSEFSSEFGFGSSSAITVCVIKALSELFEIHLTDKEIYDFSYKTVLDVQGKGSGFDVAAAVYGGTLYFVTDGKTILPLSVHNLPLVIGYSGKKTDTVEMINKVSEKSAKEPEIVTGIYNSIATLVEKAKIVLQKSDWKKLGKLMNQNQEYLEKLGVSTDTLDQMIIGARSAGAYGAKLSGAGGGDCMITLTEISHKQKVIRAIEEAGGTIIALETNAQGVRVE